MLQEGMHRVLCNQLLLASPLCTKKEFDKLPERRPWDHAIELKKDTPATLPAKAYRIPPDETESMVKFVAEQKKLKRMQDLKSPYASPFFFIKKKDGKLRPVQDY